MRLILQLHKHNWLIILSSAFMAFVATFKFHFLPQAEFTIFSLLVLFYLGWALTFHYFDKSLKLEIMLEYILTAALALIFLYGVLL